MAYSKDFIRVAVRGYLGNSTTPTEKFQWGFKVKTESVGYVGITPIATFISNIRNPIQTFHQNTTLRTGTTAFLIDVTGAQINVDGKYEGLGAQQTVVVPFTSPIPGSGTTTNPFSTACVLSLRSSVLSRGHGSHGRCYVPLLGLGVDTVDGTWGTTFATTVATAAGTMFSAINTAAAATSGLQADGVYNMSPIGSGIHVKVDRVLVGKKPDRQERRERDIQEAWAAATVT